MWMMKTGALEFEKIVSVEKMLSTGKIGTRIYEGYDGLEALQDNPEKGLFPRTEKSFELRKYSEKKEGKEEKILIDPEYLQNLDLYVYTDGEPKPKKTDLMAKAMAKEDFDIYSQRPDLFNQMSVAEDFVLARGGDPDRLINKEPQVAPPPTQPNTTAQPGISNELTGAPKRLMQ